MKTFDLRRMKPESYCVNFVFDINNCQILAHRNKEIKILFWIPLNWDRIFRNLYKQYPLRTSFKRLHTGFLIVIDPFNINEINILKSETFHISRFSLNMTIQNKFVIMFTLKLCPYTLELTDMLSRVISII